MSHDNSNIKLPDSVRNSDDDLNSLLTSSKTNDEVLKEWKAFLQDIDEGGSSSPHGSEHFISNSGSNGDDEAEDDDDESVWCITDKQLQYYTEQFLRIQSDPKKLISRENAYRFFELSRLSKQELAKILNLAGVPSNSDFSLTNFIITMHLIVLYVNEVPIPETLPVPLHPTRIFPAVSSFLANTSSRQDTAVNFQNVKPPILTAHGSRRIHHSRSCSLGSVLPNSNSETQANLSFLRQLILKQPQESINVPVQQLSALLVSETERQKVLKAQLKYWEEVLTKLIDARISLELNLSKSSV